MTNLMHKFFIDVIYLFTSILYISGFILAHLQRQGYNFDGGSSPLGMVSAPGDDTLPRGLEPLPKLYACL
jgi:hypothetical protein